MLEVEYLLLVKLKRQVIVEQRKEEKKGSKKNCEKKEFRLDRVKNLLYEMDI